MVTSTTPELVTIDPSEFVVVHVVVKDVNSWSDWVVESLSEVEVVLELTMSSEGWLVPLELELELDFEEVDSDALDESVEPLPSDRVPLDELRIWLELTVVS